MNTTLRRTGIAAIALSSTIGLAACGSSNSSGTAATGDSTNAASQTFGAGCSAVPTSGAGSFKGMATAPVASAASANPLLSTPPPLPSPLLPPAPKADLVDTLNSQKSITVFAPTNDAFAAIPPKTLKSVLADKALLTKILTYHVVAGALSPDQLAGSHKTLEGDTLKISGNNPDFVVGTQKATIVCGNVPTANATVYIIDQVLMPPS
jgi:uncharacterized surface protein with fasciclin (FAS1) repeats